jgi:hypothetical protein
VDLVVDQMRELEHVDVAHGGGLLELSPVMPSYSCVLPELGRPADLSSALISVSRAPSKTAVPNQMPRFMPAATRMVCSSSRSRSWVSAAVPAKRALKKLAHLAGLGHLGGSLGDLLAQFV